jgi:hypothetical protein
MCQYVKATELDLKECQNLKNQVVQRLIDEGTPIWNDEYPNDDCIKEDIFNGYARMLKKNDEIIAFAALMAADKEFGKDVFEKNTASFSRLMVKSNFLNQGVGTYFVTCLAKEAKQMGYKALGILVHDINEKAKKMYEKLKFDFLGKRQFEYGEFLLYRLNL